MKFLPFSRSPVGSWCEGGPRRRLPCLILVRRGTSSKAADNEVASGGARPPRRQPADESAPGTQRDRDRALTCQRRAFDSLGGGALRIVAHERGRVRSVAQELQIQAQPASVRGGRG